MKIKINRNILWSKVFIDQLAALGVKYACISPGSRSTPLTYTLSRNRKIKSFIHIDERSSAFFALGLAKVSGKPVIIVTTSGTAVAELYPAIVEAYQQRTPLIICTADRPPELIGTGANQTINQHNIFSNHIRWFRDLGLPSISEIGLNHLQKIAIKAYQISFNSDKGPVHLNFPFRKPLEPNTHTDMVSDKIIRLKPQRNSLKNITSNHRNEQSIINKIVEGLIRTERGLIIAGPMEYNGKVSEAIKKLSRILRYPLLADGLSQIRFGIKKNDGNIVANFNSILRSENFRNHFEPDIILQFGRTPTSSVLEGFLSETNAERYLVNFYGDRFDPTGNAKAVIQLDPENLCQNLIEKLRDLKFSRQKSDYLKAFVQAEVITEKIKSRIIAKAKFPNEPSIIPQIINSLPTSSNIFIGNSLPVRDLDNFVSVNSIRFSIHFNRGASGIDGITSTALGLASNRKPTILITGDLSFIYDLSALITAKKYSIKLVIIVINNNGGGIFESLPIANNNSKFNEYFVTPHHMDLGKIVNSLAIDYRLITNLKKLNSSIKNGLTKNYPVVLEIKTDAKKSLELRQKYFNEVKKKLNKEYL
ncbi:MAG: 2-succinyl-5-enolpyruvyl-6-hydroxy-3-cyclohexene-1-carboxylic-acid synthase [bacterium]|nr:2-succinyl-5-enolpyruvyl-6-hydroxy-3-cyclohexene-1-carboxylic-acid synthase [bacterium]